MFDVDTIFKCVYFRLVKINHVVVSFEYEMKQHLVPKIIHIQSSSTA